MTPLSHFITLDEMYIPVVTESGIYLIVGRETSRKLDSWRGDAKKRKQCKETSGSVKRKRFSTYLDAQQLRMVARHSHSCELLFRPRLLAIPRPAAILRCAIRPFFSSISSPPWPVARTWRRPFPGCGVPSAQAPTPDCESLPATIAQSALVRPHPSGLLALLVHPTRLLRSAIGLKPSTLLALHKAISARKYRILFSPKRHQKPSPKGPSAELIRVVVEMKQRNPTWSCPRIAMECLYSTMIISFGCFPACDSRPGPAEEDSAADWLAVSSRVM